MPDSILPILPYNGGDEQPQSDRATAKKSHPGGQGEIKWKVVAHAPGIVPATIIANRLRSEAIPARAWQEGAGQALGLTVGLLGTGYVAVPEEYEAEALEILQTDEDDFIVDEEDDIDE